MMLKSRIQFPKAASPSSYYAADLAKHYQFPTVPAGAPTVYVAVISLGGGYKMSDVTKYLKDTGINHLVDLQDIKVDAQNTPGDDADTENDLDIQTIIGAGGGKVGIYFLSAQNTDASFAAAIRKARSLTGVAAISVSWGAPETQWTAQARAAMDAEIKAAWDAGIPVVPASGDGGSKDGEAKHTADYPASCPWAVGAGGTSLATGHETGWNFGGGGPSGIYSRPSWQTHSTFAMRGVPDMAANADPDSGYKIVVNGQWGVVGGTSAAAPLLATWMALIKVNGGSLKDFLPKIYSDWLMGDILEGSNGDYQASTGYDYVSGAGVPTKAAADAFLNAAPPVPPTPTPTPDPVPPPVQQCPCPGAAPAILRLVKAFNAVRHNRTESAMVPFTNQEVHAIETWVAATNGLPCDKLATILQTVMGLCPAPAPAPAPSATPSPCAGLANLAGLLQLIQQLGPVIQQIGPVLQQLQALCPPPAAPKLDTDGAG